MKKLCILSVAAIALCACARKAPDIQPTYSAEAARLLAYVDSIYGKRTLSSTMANVAWNTAEADLVFDTLGKRPAMIGLDYIDIRTDDDTTAGAYRPYDNFELAKRWWDEGGLISICWHWFVPKAADATSITFRPDTEFRVANMLKEGTWENGVMRHDMALVAARLGQFRDAGIPVIWRPLHEAAGNTVIGGEPWFWWGNSGAEAYVALWRYMHDYFRAEGLNNLVWVWTTETGLHGDSLASDAAWYPGDDYVDLIGRDSYHKTAEQCFTEYEAIRKSFPSKTLVLSECGDVATIAAQWEAGARWAWFMPWYQYNTKTLVGHEWADASWWASADTTDVVLWRGDVW